MMNYQNLYTWASEHQAYERSLQHFWEAWSVYRHEHQSFQGRPFPGRENMVVRVESLALRCPHWPALDDPVLMISIGVYEKELPRQRMNRSGQHKEEQPSLKTLGDYKVTFTPSGEIVNAQFDIW